MPDGTVSAPGGRTVAALLRRYATDPGRVLAVIDGGPTITYAEQLSRSRRVAAGLAARGAHPGDRVHVQLPNCREFLDVWFATALSGTVLVPTGPQSSGDELTHVLADARPVVSVLDAGGVHALLEAPEAGPGHDHAPQDVAAILYTSGTTSRAKGVVLTAANYVAVGEAVARHLDMTERDRWLVALPLFHANAQYYCVMSALVRGASFALAPRFSASGWGRQVRELHATLGSLFAAPLRMVLAHPRDPLEGGSALRAVLFAQDLTPADAQAFERRFGTRLLQLYGMTETVLPPTMNPDDGTRRWDSIGRPLPGVRIDLLDERGEPFDEVGRVGEMRVAGVRGRTLAAGYWQDPTATAAAFTPAGLRTGDLARRDAQGFLSFVDRSRDMIKRAGENVSAGEVERVAGEHPAVAECAVVGVPDPVRDQAVLLVAVPRPAARVDPDDLVEWCRQRLSPFKVPSAVVLTTALPRTSVGKIRKAELHALLTSPPALSPLRPQPDPGGSA